MTETILRAHNLSVELSVSGIKRTVVSNVSFSLKAGLTTALIGSSGSGKSVTALSILKLIPSSSARYSGSIFLDEIELSSLSERQLRIQGAQSIGMIFQEPRSSLNPLHPVGGQIKERYQCVFQTPCPSDHLSDTLNRVGLSEEMAHRLPHQLSGGQCQRAMIAMAIVTGPRILIADEPTTALDVTVQRQILDLINGIRDRSGISVLLISHDVGVIRYCANEILVMEKGSILERSDAASIFEKSPHEYTQSLLTTKLPSAVKKNSSLQKKELLTLDRVCVSYEIPSGLMRMKNPILQALKGVSLTLCSGSVLGIVGESGSGKSTLGLALMGLIAYRGSIRFQGQEIGQLPIAVLRRLRSSMQILFQDSSTSLNPRMNVSQIVEEGLLCRRVPAEQRALQVAETLNSVGLDSDVVNRYPNEFSGGQRQRISLARVLILNPQMLILDEPTASLDKNVQYQIIELLQKLKSDLNLSYIFITHDLALVKELADEILVLKDGIQMEYQKAEAVISHPKSDYTKDLIQAQLY